MGSTDVGDVRAGAFRWRRSTSTFPAQAPGHSWQNVSCGRTSIAHKNMLLAGKVIAATAIDLDGKAGCLAGSEGRVQQEDETLWRLYLPGSAGCSSGHPGREDVRGDMAESLKEKE